MQDLFGELVGGRHELVLGCYRKRQPGLSAVERIGKVGVF